MVSGLDGVAKQPRSLQEGHEAAAEDKAILSRANIIISSSHVLLLLGW